MVQKPNIQEDITKIRSKLLLDLLKKHNVKITFFVTGLFYQKYPDIVNALISDGHELAYHGHTHCRIENPEILSNELKLSKRFLKHYTIKGFRAPWIFLPETCLPLLRDHGFIYDSSTFAQAGMHFEDSGMKIFPVSSFPSLVPRTGLKYSKRLTAKSLLHEIPVGAGIFISYSRIFFSSLLSEYTRKKISCIFYMHLWQLFPPLKKYSLLDGLRFIHNFPLYTKLEGLLKKHAFQPMYKLIKKTPHNANTHYLTFDLE